MTSETQPSLFRRLLGHPLALALVQPVLLLGIFVLFKATLLKPGLALFLDKESEAYSLVQGSITVFVVLGLYVLFVRIFEKRSASELSLGALPRNGLLGIALGAGVIGFLFVLLWMFGAWRIDGLHDPRAYMLATVWVLSMATFEELAFRGFAYRHIEQWLGTIAALALSGALFGGLHITNEGATAISVFSAATGGVLMGVLYSWSGSLWLPIFFHTSWNSAQAFFGSNVSGIDIFSAYFASTREGPEWLTGGAFGIENSYVTIGLLWLIIIFALIRLATSGKLRGARSAP